MQNLTHNPSDTELSRGFTVARYKKAISQIPPDRDAIATMICNRFTERYIAPVSIQGTHGFTIMAVSCLMIEALETFRQGWKNSERQSKAAFCYFFDASEPFKDFRGYVQIFYTHIRCGILHQAETTGGWRIRRDKSPLIDVNNLTINAELFLNVLKLVLDDYCDMLKAADWESTEWRNARNKLGEIVKNCRIPIDSHS